MNSRHNKHLGWVSRDGLSRHKQPRVASRSTIAVSSATVIIALATVFTNRTSSRAEVASVLGDCCVQTICPCQSNYYDTEAPALVCGQVTVEHSASVFECFGDNCDLWPRPSETIFLSDSADLTTCDGGGPAHDEANPLDTVAVASCLCDEGETRATTTVSSEVLDCTTTAAADSLEADIFAQFTLTATVDQGCMNLCGQATAAVSTPVVTNCTSVGCGPLGPPTTAIPFEVSCPVYADVTATLTTSWLVGDDGRGIGIWVIRDPAGVVECDIFDFEEPDSDTRAKEVLLLPGVPYTFLTTYSVLDASAQAGIGTSSDTYQRNDHFDVDVVFRPRCVQAVDYCINRGTWVGDDCAQQDCLPSNGACILCSDDLRVHVNSGPGLSVLKPHVVEFDAGLVAAADCIDQADTLDVAVELQTTIANTNVQLHLRNWTTGAFQAVGGVTTIPANVDTLICVPGIANASNFIRNDGRIDVRVETWTGVIPTLFYTNRIDLVQVEIRPHDP